MQTTLERPALRHHVGMLRIGELARVTGENVRTLRYWEGEGLLAAARSDSGYRLFLEGMIERLAWAEANPEPDCHDGCVYLSAAVTVRTSAETA